jgi:hypothetical protein
VRGRFKPLNTRKATKVRNAFVAFVLFLRFTLLQHLALDFFDEERQVGAGEAQVWGWDAMMLDVRRNVLIVREASRQAGIVGVFPGIIPVELSLALPDFIRIGCDPLAGEIKTFIHAQHNTLVELNPAFHNSNCCTAGVNAYRMASHNRCCIQKNINDLAVRFD